jgi:hypothetical protein
MNRAIKGIMGEQDKILWFAKAVKFQIEGLIFLIMKHRKNGVGTWTIEDTGTKKVLNSNMEWEPELPTAKRDPAFIIRTRFDLETAITMYEQYKMFS